MSYIDKKENVIEIELTQFGKRLLSKGVFKPEYYQFFDDDIIYDSKYGGKSDGVNKAQDRIKETPRLSTRYTSTGLETRYEKESDEIEAGTLNVFENIKFYQDTSDETKVLHSPIGDMLLNRQEPPSFKLDCYDSFMTNSDVTYLTASGTPQKIPQLTLKPEHRVIIDTRNAGPDPGINYDSESSLDFTLDEIQFLDGSVIKQDTESIIISLEEINVKYTKDNFELEIYEVVESSDPEIQDEIIPIKDMEHIMKYFDIKTDNSVSEVSHRPGLRSFFKSRRGQ